MSPEEILQVVADELTDALARAAERISGGGDPSPEGEVDVEALADEIRGGDWFTVVGFWPQSKERYHKWIQAPSARQAEDLARMGAIDQEGVLYVCGVYAGKLQALDAYATFADDPDRVVAIEEVEDQSDGGQP